MISISCFAKTKFHPGNRRILYVNFCYSKLRCVQLHSVAKDTFHSITCHTHYNLGPKGAWVVKASPQAALTPEMTRYLLCRRFDGPRSGLEGYGWLPPPPSGFDPPIVQLVATHYSEYDIPLGCLSVLRQTFVIRKVKKKLSLCLISRHGDEVVA